MLLAYWAGMHLGATATTATLCNVISGETGSWWIPLLLASSAFQEFLIAVASILLLHRTVSAESRTTSLKLCLGISGASPVLYHTSHLHPH